MTDDCQARIKGAKNVGAAAPDLTAEIERVWAAGQQEKSMQMRAAGLFFRATRPLASALRAKLMEAGIRPIAECDNEEVVISRQAQADIEYYFAVNAAWDEKEGTLLSIKPVTATLGFAADGRPTYDAVRGGPVVEFKEKPAGGLFRFGAGEMRAFARTARPIGGVQVQTPVLSRDFTLDAAPVSITADATLVDTANLKLAGAAPMQVRVVDPLGSLRYDLYRAAEMGTLRLSLPLAANDPAGIWTVTVKELLDNHAGSAKFVYRPAGQCGSLAGATRRAVFFGNDRENIFRFIRTHQDVTIVKGTSDYCGAAAERLAASPQTLGRPRHDRPRRGGQQAADAHRRRGEDLGRPRLRPCRGWLRQPPAEGRLRAYRPGHSRGQPGRQSAHRIRAVDGLLALCPRRGLPRPWARLSGLAARCPRLRQESIALIADDAAGYGGGGRIVLRGGGRHRPDDAMGDTRRQQRSPRHKEPASGRGRRPLAGHPAGSRARAVRHGAGRDHSPLA